MIERLLRRFIKHEDLGWKELNEKFTRFLVFESKYFSVFIHKMDGPIAPPKCHDHPWSFVSFILRGGYWESTDGTVFHFRAPGDVIYRRAEHAHTVKTTPPRIAWTLVITGPVRRKWKNHDCK
jgi:hypothetical protein